MFFLFSGRSRGGMKKLIIFGALIIFIVLFYAKNFLKGPDPGFKSAMLIPGGEMLVLPEIKFIKT